MTTFDSGSAITFDSEAEFYGARGGLHSGESDFGVLWNNGPRWPTYRVSVVHATGDVYAAAPGIVVLLGNVGTNRLSGHLMPEGNVRPIRCEAGCAYDAAERLLEGWVDHIHDETSLGWVRERLNLMVMADR